MDFMVSCKGPAQTQGSVASEPVRDTMLYLIWLDNTALLRYVTINNST